MQLYTAEYATLRGRSEARTVQCSELWVNQRLAQPEGNQCVEASADGHELIEYVLKQGRRNEPHPMIVRMVCSLRNGAVHTREAALVGRLDDQVAARGCPE